MRFRRRSIPALLGLLVACAAAAPAQAVVQGTPVEPTAVPWFVDLGGCGGTLVAPDRVLTAAHCVHGQRAEAYKAISVGGVSRSAEHLALHPNWRASNGPLNHLDDVALFQLDAPVTGVPLVTLGGAEPAEANILGRGMAFAPGTGHSQEEMLDTTLRTASLRSISDAACAKAFEGFENPTGERFDKRMRCSVDVDGREPLNSGCFGDSGGPLWTGTADHPIQLGVVSWGGNCGADHRPSVFADVARYRDFVYDPSPTWAPEPTREAHPRISGARRAGHTLTCSPGGYHPPRGSRLEYVWNVVGAGTAHFGAPKEVGHGRAYGVARADTGHHVACMVDAANDGGFALVGLARAFIR